MKETNYNLVADWLKEIVESLKQDLDYDKIRDYVLMIEDLENCAKGKIAHNDMCCDARCVVGDYEESHRDCEHKWDDDDCVYCGLEKDDVE